MSETIGQREDAAAFLRVWRNYHRTKGWWIVIGQEESGAGQRKHDVRERELMRYAFDAGMKRGEEKGDGDVADSRNGE